jgi:hypothetical protein
VDSPIAAGADGWRALPARTRDHVWRAARTATPASDVATATAAVAYGRHVRRQQNRAGYALSGLMAVLLGLAAQVGGSIPAIAGRSVLDTQRALVLAAFAAAAGALVAFVQGGIGVRKLIGANLPLAAAGGSGAAGGITLRVGRRFPRATEVVEVLGVVAAYAVLARMHNDVTLVVLTVAVGAFLVVGPGALDPVTARLDADGIHIARWRVTVPWSSVRGVDLAGDQRVGFQVSGGFRNTGRLPATWRARIAREIESGFTVTCRQPELLMWTARRHLDLAAGR